jgi:hypothetical protein
MTDGIAITIRSTNFPKRGHSSPESAVERHERDDRKSPTTSFLEIFTSHWEMFPMYRGKDL